MNQHNAKNQLQEYCMKQPHSHPHRALPKYNTYEKVANSNGLNGFTSEVTVGGRVYKGHGGTKKAAEQSAARVAYLEISLPTLEVEEETFMKMNDHVEQDLEERELLLFLNSDRGPLKKEIFTIINGDSVEVDRYTLEEAPETKVYCSQKKLKGKNVVKVDLRGKKALGFYLVRVVSEMLTKTTTHVYLVSGILNHVYGEVFKDQSVTIMKTIELP